MMTSSLPAGSAAISSPAPSSMPSGIARLLVCAERFRGLDIAILISRSFDGELIARTVELLGFVAIRGSSSRGGATGLRNMQLAYEAGHRCAFTADGPRGPAHGPETRSRFSSRNSSRQNGSAATTPCHERAWELKSWDRFIIPASVFPRHHGLAAARRHRRQRR